MDKRLTTALIVILSGLLVWSLGSSGSGLLASEEGHSDQQAAVAPLLQYQGRLTDPDTGEAVADGDFTMTFRLYAEASAGTPLWTETKDVSVKDGVFSTALGDATALDPALFNGQALWLGIKVEADAEATPRQRILPVAYAMGLVPGAHISTSSSSPALAVSNAGAGAALEVDGSSTLNGDLSVSGSLSGGSHSHDGGDITSGTVDEARVDDQIARDDEIIPTILGDDGPGSGLDADTLDGQDSGEFSPADHSHSGADITTGIINEKFVDPEIARDNEIMPTVLGNDGSGSGLDADKLDGHQASQLMSAAGSVSIYGFTTSDVVEEMDSFIVDVPAAGTLTIIVMGSTWLDCDATSADSRLCISAHLGICDASGSSSSCGNTYFSRYDYQDPDNANSTNKENWVTLGRTVDVGPGTRQFYVNGESPVSGMRWQINGYALALFAPRSMEVTKP